jgi:hypothetical protein
MQDDVVLLEVVAAIAGHAAQRTLEGAVVERLDPAAAAADEVMVVLPARECGLEAGDAVGQVDLVDEPKRPQLLEDAVDARDADRPPLCLQAVMELVCRDAAVPAREVVDDGIPSPSST